MTREKWREHNKSVSPRFQKIPGLIRKQFLYDDNGNGGNREAAEACYSGPWKDAVAAIALSEPHIAWFETAVIVDNESHQVKVSD
jgi:hypothetical protein